MTNQFTIEGKLFCFAGRLSRRTLKMYQRLVNRHDGRYTAKLTKKVDVLIIGSNPGKKLDQAVKWGIWVVEEFDFDMYIDHGLDIAPPSHEVREENSLDTNELFGQLRATLDGSPDDAMWAQITEVIDTTPAQDLEVLTQYLLQHMNRWHVDRWQNWTLAEHVASVQSTFGNDTKYSMAQYHPRDILCFAPEHWMEAMKLGVSQPHESLIRAMDWRSMQLTGTFAAKLISCEHLTNLTHLNAGNVTLSKGFFTALRTAPCAPKLRTLKFTNMKRTYLRGIEGDHQLDALREVTWWNTPYHVYDRDIVTPFFRAACFEQVTRFTCSCNWTSLDSLRTLRLPNLKQLNLAGSLYYMLDMNDWMRAPLLDDIKILGFESNYVRDDQYTARLCELALTRRFDVLDLSRLYLWDDAASTMESFAKSTLIRSFDAVYLGPFEQMRACFEAQGVSVCDALPS